MLNDGEYSARLPVLSGASIGEHVRHVVEFFQELQAGYFTGHVDYDARKREKALETRRDYAILRLQQMAAAGLQKDNKVLQLAFHMKSAGTTYSVETNYEREMLYNLEHAVHHMALMKIGVRTLTDMDLPENFGIASSTIEYRQSQCAQ